MTEKRFTAFTDYLGGTQTILDNGERKTLQELLDTMNELADENEQLKQTCQMVEDTYHALQKKFHNWDIALSKCRDENEQLKSTKRKRLVRLRNQRKELLKQQEAIWGYKGDIKQLRKENEQLKQQKDKWKQQCIHFKEMLDDMDIAYLCDEWIYEELNGDVE